MSILNDLTGFLGINWTVIQLRRLGLIGINYNHKQYLLIKIINLDRVDGLSVIIDSPTGSYSLTTDALGYAYLSNREFQTATITVIKDGIPVSKDFDINVQTNQYIEINIAIIPIIEFPAVNPIRVVVTDQPIVKRGIDQEFHINHPDPFFYSDFYAQKMHKQSYTIQFKSNFTLSNTVKIFDQNDDQIGSTVAALLKKDTRMTLGYNRYEVTVNFSGLNDGLYYLLFEGTDVTSGSTLSYEAKSELLDLRANHKATLEFSYYNNSEEIAFDCDYSTGIRHKILVEGEMWRTKFSGEKEVWEDDSYTMRNLSAVKRKYAELKINGVPHYLLDKVNLALDHDFVFINGQQVVSNQDIEPVIENDLSLVKAEAWIAFKEAFINRS